MSNKQALVGLTQKLIAFPTPSIAKEKNAQLLDFIKKYLFSNDICITEYFKNGYKSLVITSRKPASEFDVILHGHVDVVPAISESDYRPYSKNGKIYGRGAVDMKGGLAIMLVLFKKLVKQNNRKVALYITSDEEVGGKDGTGYLLKKLKPKAKFFITLEGDKNYVLKYEQKGVLRFRLLVKGKSVHSSYAWLGDNAIKKFFKVYQEIEKLFPKDKHDKEHWCTTINLGTIHGGIASNAVPDCAYGDIDIRIAEDWESPKNILEAIKKILKQTPGVWITDIKMSQITKISKDNPYLVRLNSIAKKQLSAKKDFYYRTPGANDTRFSLPAGIPGVSFGPIGGNFHAKNEYVSIESLEKFYAILSDFIDSFNNK